MSDNPTGKRPTDRRSPSNLEETTGFLGGLFRQARLVWSLWKDSRTPSWLKLIPVAGLVYLISPIDLIPDWVLPGLGELDDLAIILLSLKAFVDLAPPGIVREHLDRLMGRPGGAAPQDEASAEPYIDAPYSIVGDDVNPDNGIDAH
jgi:uncharacterized membrane protein YkvA (DUF1232 family)